MGVRAARRQRRVAAATAVCSAAALGAVGGYVLGDRDTQPPRGASTYTVRRGDVVVAPAAAARCEASAEGGFENLFCMRTPRGRYEVVFYRDSVLVWDHRTGPDGPAESYRWDRK